MQTNIRKTLVQSFLLVYTSIIIPRSLLNSNIEIYYEENALTRQIIVYDYTKRQEPILEFYNACSRKCPNETLSEGYDESYEEQDDYEEEKPTQQRQPTPLIFDPAIFHLMNSYR